MNDNRPIRYDADDPSSVGNDYFCVVLASLAYKPQLEMEKELREHGYHGTSVLNFRTPLASGFILEWDNVIAVAFKGTTTWREWLNNFNVWLEPVQHGRIHAGFMNTINQVGPIIYRIILAGILSGSKIVLTGHSRGGALAQLFAAFLALNGHRVDRVCVFGSPRIGDREFASLWRDLPDEPEVTINPSLSVAIARWLMGFRVIFVPVVLYHSFRVIFPHPLSYFGKWLARKLSRLPVNCWRILRPKGRPESKSGEA